MTLRALNEMFSMSRDDLGEIALSIGSDVPFFLVGGTAYATSRGETLTPIEPMAGIPLLLLMPEERVMTADAFARVSHYSEPLGLDAYRSFGAFSNDFEEPVFAMIPRLRELKERLITAGASWAQMSGSGSTIVGSFETADARDEAAAVFDDVRVMRAETV
jgi:4-diphosphocytidyl-2-C-methyl-D-erythritol kinase